MTGRVKGLVQELMKEGVLHAKPTGYGLQISVNVERMDAAQRYIDAFLGNPDL